MNTIRTKEESKILLMGTMQELGEKLVPIVKESIDKILEYKSKRWIDVVDEKTKNKTVEILNLIQKIRPDTELHINRIINSLNTHTFVYDENGKWDYINKLNTNRSDFAVFISDLLEKSKEFEIYEMYRDLKKNDFSNLKKFVNNLPKHADFIWDNFLNQKEKYIQNILQNSKEGEIVENFVSDYFHSMGWTVIYKGGDGELIDMLLGLDLIVERDGEYKLIQVKKLSLIEDTQIEDKNFIKIRGNVIIRNLSIIDTVAYASLDGKVFAGGKQEYFYNSSDGLVRCYGFPIPSKVNKNEILIKN